MTVFHKILVSFVFLLIPVSSQAASHYIRIGAAGANTGSSWTDAYNGFPSSTTYIRGDEYYVAGGTYPNAATFSTSQSGTAVIKICKATISTIGQCTSAHGTAGDWNDSYASQTIFNGPTSGQILTFNTPYWTLDGVTGAGSTSSSGSDPSTYGFYVHVTTITADMNNIFGSGSSSHLTISHTASDCVGAGHDFQQMAFSMQGQFAIASYDYTNNCQGSFWNQNDDWIIEYSYLGFQVYVSATHHGDQIYAGARPIFRYNTVMECNSQCVEPDGGCTQMSDSGAFYGNTFSNIVTGNGIAKGTCNGAFTNTVFYNNTIINSQGPLLYQNNAGSTGKGSGNIVQNNIFYNSTGCCVQSDGSAISASYNAYYDSGTHSESNEQDGTGSPIVNIGGACSGPSNCAIGDYHLVSATNAGLSLSSPYDFDLLGTARGSSGVWDRGAIEYCAGGCGAGTVTVTPANAASFSGIQGQFPNGQSLAYTLTNTEVSGVAWSALANQTWLSLTATSGTVQAGGAISTTVSINGANGNPLTPGTYTGTITFTCADSSCNGIRTVTLVVSAVPSNTRSFRTRTPSTATYGNRGYGSRSYP